MSLKHALGPAAIGVWMATAPVAAHAPDVVTRDHLWRSWTFEPLVLFSLVAAIWLYARGVACVWARAGRGRVVSPLNALSFAGGMTALVIALMSPLDSLGGTLLSAHMAQHGLLAGVAPPLLVVARPGAALAWGMKPLWNVDPMTSNLWRSTVVAIGRVSRPVLATGVHAVMLWVWHAPALFNAAVVHDWVHALQHLCFFVPALFFWRSLLDADSHRRAGIPALAAFLTFMHTGLLGGLLTMAPQPLYESYFRRPEVWRFTALEDQQLAGVLMWVPLGLPYLAVGLWLASRVIAVDDHAATQSPPAGRSVGQEAS